jgi:hypothetical protein
LGEVGADCIGLPAVQSLLGVGFAGAGAGAAAAGDVELLLESLDAVDGDDDSVDVVVVDDDFDFPPRLSVL